MATKIKSFLSCCFLCVLVSAVLWPAGEVLGQACTYSLAPANLKAKSQLEYYSIRVKTRPDCNWTAASSKDWVTFPASPSGTGSGSFKVEVAANPTDMKRVAHVFIGAKGMTITQEPMACQYSLSASQVTMPPAPGSGQLQIQTASGCRWMAVSSEPAWLTPAYTSGRGPGVVTYHVGRYAGTSDRRGRITAGGKTLMVTQEGCRYALSAAQQHMPASGGAGAFQMVTQASCPWKATCSADWISLTKSDPSGGNTQVTFSAAPNTSSQPRQALIRAAGKNFRVDQSGQAPASVE